jgi:hypothetical protein
LKGVHFLEKTQTSQVKFSWVILTKFEQFAPKLFCLDPHRLMPDYAPVHVKPQLSALDAVGISDMTIIFWSESPGSPWGFSGVLYNKTFKIIWESESRGKLF